MNKELEDKIKAKMKLGLQLTKKQYAYWVLYMKGVYSKNILDRCPEK